MQKFWIAVVSAQHVRMGRQGGYMQAGHGKLAPLKRIAPGDGVAYYSPTEVFGVSDNFRQFTAAGFVKAGEPYAFDMGNGFVPFRRDLDWLNTRETPITPLLEKMAFSAGKTNWGYKLRFGLFDICAADFEVICAAMRTKVA